MRIVVNGRDREVPEGTTITDLLRELDLPAGPRAVELNREVVPRSRHETTVLREGDRVEVVSLVGGG